MAAADLAANLAENLVLQRIRNQKLMRTPYRQPEEVVSWLAGVQSQDYIGAKWALGLRARGLTDAAVDRAYDEGRILRTHVLRPTWHFVAPQDIRWMLALTAPRVHGFSAYYYRKHELEQKLFARCHKSLARALEGGKHLTRTELQDALRKTGIESNNLRLGLILMHAELSALICSGARRGKQHTYALLEERVPRASPMSREEALAALTARYVTSHGPVTVHDYAWWSGLNMRDARKGIEMLASECPLEQRAIDECTYWSLESQASVPRGGRQTPVAWLLPNYDEYYIAYKDRRATQARHEFAHLLTIDGWLSGSWKRTLANRTAGVEVRAFRTLKKPERDALDEAVSRYAAFLDVPVTLTFS
jgi:hypothetical protein